MLTMPVRSRSKKNDKHLVLLAKCSVVKKHGLLRVMAPLIEDLKKMETEGIRICGERVYGSVLCICGDNLSLHQIGAFRECFSGGLICGFSMTDKSEISTKWHEHQFILRTRQSHSRHVLLIKDDRSLSAVYGVNGDSCMHSLTTFDPTRSLPPDNMHDLFEGAIPFVLKHD